MFFSAWQSLMTFWAWSLAAETVFKISASIQNFFNATKLHTIYLSVSCADYCQSCSTAARAHGWWHHFLSPYLSHLFWRSIHLFIVSKCVFLLRVMWNPGFFPGAWGGKTPRRRRHIVHTEVGGTWRTLRKPIHTVTWAPDGNRNPGASHSFWDLIWSKADV